MRLVTLATLQPDKTLDSGLLDRMVVGCSAAQMVLYFAISTHTPIVVNPLAMHDDGLFIELGRYLAEGHWLGPFSQFTLMKGPGYPLFLALARWLGLSVTQAHSFFHCFSIAVFVLILHRFVRSHFLSGLLFTLLLWHPITLSVHLLRVLRDEIYYGQVLLILAALTATVFAPSGKRLHISWSLAVGLVFGWFWLTREEGFWLLPGLAIVVAGGILKARRSGGTRQLLTSLSIVVCTFAIVQVGFRLGNLWAYGKFVGVDVKETNFERALGALDSVRSGGTKPFIPVTQSARQKIYAVSPSFASLKEYFDSSQELGWVTISCRFYPDSCGEIAGGWFMWGLRDAASLRGQYVSPSKASAFFGRMADEIQAACLRAELDCSPQLIPEMPPVTWSDLYHRSPPRYAAAAHLLLFINPPLQFNPSAGTESELAPALAFLGRPLYNRSADMPGKYVLSGWYYESGDKWFSADVTNADGTRAQTKIARTPSLDIQSAFNDPAASQQRFLLEAICNGKCFLNVAVQNGDNLEKSTAEIRGGSSDIKVGEGNVHIDSVTSTLADPFAPTKVEAWCNDLRIFFMTKYVWIFLPILAAGLISFIAVTVFRFKTVVSDVCYILGTACWILVLARTSLLVLVDATSFPALTGFYMAPAYFLLVSGAVLFCASLLNSKSNKPRPVAPVAASRTAA